MSMHINAQSWWNAKQDTMEAHRKTIHDMVDKIIGAPPEDMDTKLIQGAAPTVPYPDGPRAWNGGMEWPIQL